MASPADIIRWIKRGLDVPQEQAERLASRTVPTVRVGSVDRWWQNDSRIVRPCWGLIYNAASVGEYSQNVLANPTNNKVNAILEHVWTGLDNVGSVYYRWVAYGTVSGWGGHYAAFRDVRDVSSSAFPIVERPTCSLLSVQQAATVGYAYGQNWLPQGADVNPGMPRVLIPPGWALVLQPATQNMRQATTFFWEEHRIAQ